MLKTHPALDKKNSKVKGGAVGGGGIPRILTQSISKAMHDLENTMLLLEQLLYCFQHGKCFVYLLILLRCLALFQRVSYTR